MGTIEVKEIFKIEKIGTIAGCLVIDGDSSGASINSAIRVLRNNKEIYLGSFSALKRMSTNINTVYIGQEFGCTITNFNDIQIGDIIEAL